MKMTINAELPHVIPNKIELLRLLFKTYKDLVCLVKEKEIFKEK